MLTNRKGSTDGKSRLERKTALSGGPAGPSVSNAGSIICDAAGPPAPPAVDGATWHYRMGEEEPGDHPMTRSVRTNFQFRGVFGTFDHAHPQGTAVLPVFETIDFGPDWGRPGRFDAWTASIAITAPRTA